MKKPILAKQHNKRVYLLRSDRSVVGSGDSLTLQDCFGYVDIANPPKNEDEQDAKMATLAFHMNCQLFKRIDTEFINPKSK